MKKNKYMFTKQLAASITLLLLVANAYSQQRDLSVYWIGKIDLPTVKLTLSFDFTATSNGEYNIQLSIPEQEAKNIPCQWIKTTTDSLVFTCDTLQRTFYGRFINDSTITGEWKRNRVSIPVTIKKSTQPARLHRPQTPRPPFPYLSEEVTYLNPASGLQLAGTLTLPKGSDPCAAVVLITGSGAQDRDQSIFQHKTFMVIADYLARTGVATLRIDDRGVGGSEGNIVTATSADFADDVLTGVNYLKNRKEIHPAKIGLIGHSEGGLIAPIAATKSESVSFIILLAGPGMPGEQILYEQNDLALKAAGMSEMVIQQNLAVQKNIFEVLKNQRDSALAHRDLQLKLSQGFYDGMNDEMKAAVDEKIKGINTPWFRYFLSYDPRPTLKKVTCPVLALNGLKDTQVPVSNLQAIEQAIKAGGNTNITQRAFENLNHLFQHCEKGAVAEYAQIEETISVEVLEVMRNWIQQLYEN
jgi:fermentation-respiration switch protein FrsA (DUF1100 family)